MSQGYTPVTWQDETTSQQGTLINAARLDQMQTAHHYADGWREVDAVPTADPGVDYHQVVYCTADSTFYRWDGSAWTKDIDDVTKAELDAEIERATLAEGALDSAKADKATTLAGYGITDAYTKAQTDTLLAGKMDDGDAYTKAEADTLLAGKADVSALTDGSVTKLGTADVGGDLYPIKLVAGVPTAVANALVDTATAQTINANKGFTNNASTTASSATVKGYYGVSNIDMASSFPGNRYVYKDCLVDANGAIIGGMRLQTTGAQDLYFVLATTKSDGTTKTLNQIAKYNRTNDTWAAIAPTPGVGAGSTEVTTVGYVSDTNGLNNLVHTNGAETIPGAKTFTGDLISNVNHINRVINRLNEGSYIFARIPSTENAHRFVIDYTSRSTGISKLQIDTNYNNGTLTITPIYNTANDPPVINLYKDADDNQYLGLDAVANDIIEISGGTFHMRTTSVGQQLQFMPYANASTYTKLSNN